MVMPVKFTGTTQTFAVLGHPVAHTLSPPMHNAALKAMGRDAVYLPYDVTPEALMDVLHSMHGMGFGGANLTLPLKEVAFEGLDTLDDSAKLVGAVNTVLFADRGMAGYSTDGYGLEAAIKECFDLDLTGQSIAIVGTGGAGRAAALHSAVHGAQHILLLNRTPAKAEKVADEIRALGTSCHVEVSALDASASVQSCGMVINSTTLGMKPGDASPLPTSAFTAKQAVMDMIYVDRQTPFMKAAAEAGARTANGLSMLLHQGARSLEIWTARDVPLDVMREALDEAVYA